MKETNLPLLSATLTAENWQQEVNRMACDSAHDTLHEIGAEGTIELGFALLQAYFTLTYSASLPFVEHDGTLAARLDTLRQIMASCGLEFDTDIITLQSDKDNV